MSDVKSLFSVSVIVFMQVLIQLCCLRMAYAQLQVECH